ncbi:MAG: hypothetical protein H0V81_10925 [Solirubrobacterales bacterium]|nr:hypothetical protein [Solirubrobacterales bacterium]
MSGWDDDDWVGEPPEGRYTSDRAKPSFWWHSRAAQFGFLGLALAIVLLLAVVLL